jgi:hypothetical protein
MQQAVYASKRMADAAGDKASWRIGVTQPPFFYWSKSEPILGRFGRFDSRSSDRLESSPVARRWLVGLPTRYANSAAKACVGSL